MRFAHHRLAWPRWPPSSRQWGSVLPVLPYIFKKLPNILFIQALSVTQFWSKYSCQQLKKNYPNLAKTKLPAGLKIIQFRPKSEASVTLKSGPNGERRRPTWSHWSWSFFRYLISLLSLSHSIIVFDRQKSECERLKDSSTFSFRSPRSWQQSDRWEKLAGRS